MLTPGEGISTGGWGGDNLEGKMTANGGKSDEGEFRQEGLLNTSSVAQWLIRAVHWLKNPRGFIRWVLQSILVTDEEATLRRSSMALPMAVDLEAGEVGWPLREVIHPLPLFLMWTCSSLRQVASGINWESGTTATWRTSALRAMNC